MSKSPAKPTDPFPELPPEALRRAWDPAVLTFETTADLEPTSGIIGQPRGVQAITFGLSMANRGYNIYVLGEAGTGRTTAIQHFVEARAAGEAPPDDWVYVFNFAEEERPSALSLPPGTAVHLRDDVNTLITRLRAGIAAAFDDQAFRDAAMEVQHALEGQRDTLFSALQALARAQGALVRTGPEGFQIIPAPEGRPLSVEEYEALDDEARAAWKEIEHRLQRELSGIIFQARGLERSAEDELEALKRRVAASVVEGAVDELKADYAALPDVTVWLDALHNDILDHADAFRENGDEDEGEPESALFRRYEVNVLVEHAADSHAPVVVELDPTLPRLLGRVEHEARRGGAVITDFTLIRPGALHAANGGYLVLRALDLFDEPGAWEGLKRTLVAAEVRPDDPATRGGTAVRTLDPAPIPLRIKIILAGPGGLYYALHERDEDFRNLFKVMADFDEQVERTPETERAYAAFITTRVRGEALRDLDQSAVGRVIEYGSRLAGSQRHLSTRFGKIADLLREADYWAGEAGRALISAADVDEALAQRDYLANRIETEMRDDLLHGKQLVSTSGTAVGQINGLAVSQVGEHTFGHPSRITARAYVGSEGVIHIDREAEMAGPVHNKGVLTLIGYLGGQYAAEVPLSLSAQITFEQNYGGIDGDSASSTELYALLSSLSGVPLRQGLAVTGSVNQAGEIQAIGGVTEKVEGWFAVCRAAGLDRTQGVLIPAANVEDLMLRPDVIDAVAAGQFHVWAVSTVDEGLALLTGEPATAVHQRVSDRLRALAETLAEFDDPD